MNILSPKTCNWLLTGLLGWKSIPPCIDCDKAIILGVPHTSIWDFAIGYLYYRSYFGRNMRAMIKKEAFWGPAGWFLRKLGAFPVDRSNSTGLIVSLIHEMEKSGQFHLIICPEGTRKAVRKWKTGYHTIARQANVPVFLGYFDWKKKEISIPVKLELTDDARADTDRMQEICESFHLTGKYPDKFLTH